MFFEIKGMFPKGKLYIIVWKLCQVFFDLLFFDLWLKLRIKQYSHWMDDFLVNLKAGRLMSHERRRHTPKKEDF